MKKVYKNILRIICIVFIIVFYTVKVSTLAIDNVHFRNLTIEDGLSQTTAETIIQDSYGYIWIGTNDGLNKYNGYEFKIYRNNPQDINSIINNYIIDLKEDNEKNLWVGTANGISKINLESDEIKNYTDNQESGNLSDNNIGDILITKSGDILVGTSNGLNIYNKKEDKFYRILDGMLSSEVIYTLDEDDDGNIWAGTDCGVDKVNINRGVVENYIKINNSENVKKDTVYKVYCDKDNILWVGTTRNGVIKINTESKEKTYFFKDMQNNKSLPGNKVRNFYRDSKDDLWVCTNEGLALYNDEEDTFIVYKSKFYERNSLISDDTYSIMEDSSGLLWIGTYAGISRFDSTSKIEHYNNNPYDKNSISENMIHGIYEDEDGLIWIGTNSKGISIINRRDGKVHNINSDEYPEVLSDDGINDITGINNYIFIGTDNGLVIIDKELKTRKILNVEDGLTSAHITELYIDSKEKLWIGTVNGITTYDINNKNIFNISTVLDEHGFSNKYIRSIYEDSDGIYWIGSFVNGGLLKLDLVNDTAKIYKNDKGNNSIVNDTIRSIQGDKKGNIWIGTSGGLSKLDVDEDEFENYTINDGLPSNTIYGILLDNKENLWMSTNSGISNFNVNEKTFLNFNVSDGLQSNEFNGQAYYKNENEELFFGGINGLNIFNVESMVKDKWTAKVNYDKFEVNGTIEKELNNKVLKNNENTIKVKLFSTNYKDIKNIKYYYSLQQNKSVNWKCVDGNTILFSDLKYGDYTLKVMAKNSLNNVTDVNEIKFTIKAPFFLSKYSLIVYLMIIIIWNVHSKMKVRVLDKKVYLRTRELNDEMVKNKNLLNKIITLEEKKNNYFINLSHELRTPLNVLHTTEQLITSLNKRDEGISKEKLNYYMGVTRNNNSRLLKIINELIDTSKFENGNYKLNLEKNNIVEVVEEAALSLKEYVEDKGISLIIDPEIEEKYLIFDANEIERCIVNLVGNATKFTPNGGKIEVLIFEYEEGVKIQVKDTGIGIEKKYQDIIFDRFNQIVDKNSEVKGGSGLGLTITKHIVELHNGRIFVESNPGKGSVFTIILQ